MNLLAKNQENEIGSHELPVIIIGTGPVGIQFIKTALERMPSSRFMVFGNEPWEPYNRVKLSSFFAGLMQWDDLLASQKLPETEKITAFYNCAVISIDKQAKTVTDELGRVHGYKKLVIATGSRPFVPNIEGIHLKNIFTFRDLTDIEQLSARRVRSRKTIVVGGGVLGIEAARAMSRENTEVSIIDHLPTVMSNQLDEAAAEILQRHLLALNLKLYLGQAIHSFIGDDEVESVVLKDGTEIECDTVILTTGIQPNIDLALKAKLSIGQGIRVNDAMQTSDEHIYAIGECAQHREKTYGVVKPGYEQARVAAFILSGKKSNYVGSLTATQLKVIDVPAFSMGDNDEVSVVNNKKEWLYKNKEKNIYRRLVIKNRHVVGAVSIGEWDEQSRVQETILNKRFVWIWNKKRFEETGLLWVEKNSADVTKWPASTVVCNCTGVTRGQLTGVIGSGVNTLADISHCTGASSVCGSCKPLVAQMLSADTKVEAPKWHRNLLIFGVLSTLAITVAMFLPSIPYAESVQVIWQWDELWRSNLYKQVSGFALLGMSVIVVMMSLNKRIKKFSFLTFPFWRLVHVIVGFLTVLGLGVHSGYSIGSGVNSFLALCFVSLIVAGGLSSAMVAIEHKLDAVTSKKIKNRLVWLHILSFWPVPALLSVHVLKSYYF